MRNASTGRRVRYAVVGLGHFAQSAILPAFQHAKNSVLTALVSGDAAKRKKLQAHYRVPHALAYEHFDELLQAREVDAVYIALPNHLHKDFTVRAARANVHVLVEKPMAVSVEECREMIDACKKADVKLMTAYRLHFEANNLRSIDLIRKGHIGQPRLFSSTFTMDLREGNVREKPVPGSGPLYDIGTYCINAARGLFHDEPDEVFAFSDSPKRRRDHQTAAVLHFPNGRLATFAVSFEGFHDSRFEVVGTKGVLEANPAYQHKGALKHTLKVGNRTMHRTFAARDQVAAELVEFSDCILHDRQPEPSGEEGLLDVRVIEALIESTKKHGPVRLPRAHRRVRPSVRQEKRLPPHHKSPPLVKVASPGKH